MADAVANVHARSLDPRIRKFNPEQLAFFQSHTGIDDEEQLINHIVAVQQEAYAVVPYPCIDLFLFLSLKIADHVAYPDVLELGKARPGAILLDIGCCFGYDVRKAVADGFPVTQVIASDLKQEFWGLGHKLFNSNSSTFPVPFVQGDVFDESFISSSDVLDKSDPTTYPELKSLNLTSLNPLKHAISAIHASSFFHLFDEEQQLTIARRFASLLSPKQGSVIFGSHLAAETKGFRQSLFRKRPMFYHSPESWKQMWNTIFPEGSVKYETRLNPRVPFLVWSITRL